MYSFMSRMAIITLQQLADLSEYLDTVKTLCDYGIPQMPQEEFPSFLRQKEIVDAELLHRIELRGKTNHRTPEL